MYCSTHMRMWNETLVGNHSLYLLMPVVAIAPVGVGVGAAEDRAGDDQGDQGCLAQHLLEQDQTGAIKGRIQK